VCGVGPLLVTMLRRFISAIVCSLYALHPRSCRQSTITAAAGTGITIFSFNNIKVEGVYLGLMMGGFKSVSV
jgi:hypothetical protein